jgi:hypothetical protein
VARMKSLLLCVTMASACPLMAASITISSFASVNCGRQTNRTSTGQLTLRASSRDCRSA